MEGKQLIPAEDMVAKLRAAVAARRSDLVVIARTDARAVEGLNNALQRARLYRDAGAHVIFFEAPQTEEEIEIVAAELSDVPLLFNSPREARHRLSAISACERSAFASSFSDQHVARRHARHTRSSRDNSRDGTPVTALSRLPRFGEFTDFIGLPEIQKLKQQFSSLPLQTRN